MNKKGMDTWAKIVIFLLALLLMWIFGRSVWRIIQNALY